MPLVASQPVQIKLICPGHPDCRAPPYRSRGRLRHIPCTAIQRELECRSDVRRHKRRVIDPAHRPTVLSRRGSQGKDVIPSPSADGRGIFRNAALGRKGVWLSAAMHFERFLTEPALSEVEGFGMTYSSIRASLRGVLRDAAVFMAPPLERWRLVWHNAPTGTFAAA